MNGVGDEVLILGLDLLRVLEYILGVLLPHAAVHVVHLDLLQLLEGLEFYQKYDRIDLVLMKPLKVLQVDGEDAVLILFGKLHFMLCGVLLNLKPGLTLSHISRTDSTVVHS